MNRILFTSVLAMLFSLQLHAQIPRNIIINGELDRTPSGRMMCNDAGTITFGAFIGQSNDVSPDDIFLCFGDSLQILHNGDQDLSGNDPNLSPGVGYAFYTCEPTVMGDNLATVLGDGCVADNTVPPPTNGIFIFQGADTTGNVFFFNDGNLQDFFANGDPVQLWFAPITYESYGIPSVSFPNGGDCVNVRTDQAFSVTYLNEIDATELNTMASTTGCMGSFRVTGGLPEFDNSEVYSISVVLDSDPDITGNVIGPAFHDDVVSFFVPQPGSYTITIEDGKSCGYSFQMDMGGCEAVTLEFPLTNGLPNENVCLPFTVENFNDVASMQFSITWDATILEFTNVQAFNPSMPDLFAGLFNTMQAPNGVITFSWADLSFSGVDLPDGATVFEMCFDVIGELGECTDISFEDEPTDIEIGDSTSPDQVEYGYILNNGTFCVSDNVLFVDLEQDSVTCPSFSDGAFTVTVAGGMAPYNYTWTQIGGALNGAGTIVNSGESSTESNLPAALYRVVIMDAAMPTNTVIDTVEVLAGPVLGVILQAVNPSCFGESDGSITANITFDGVPQPNPGTEFTFSWNTTPDNVQTLSNIPFGFYAVTVTDASGCEALASATLSQPPALNVLPANTFITNATCSGSNDGDINITPSGGNTSGTGNYSFQWDSGLPASVGPSSIVTGLDAGVYCVTVTDDNSCTFEGCFTVGATKVLAINSAVTDVSCNGFGDGQIIATGSTTVGTASPPFTFTWDNFTTAPVNTMTTSTLNNLTPGVYNVTMSDSDPAGCQTTATITIVEPDPLVVDLAIPVQNETCLVGNDGIITLSVTGGTFPYSYLWSDNQMDSIAVNLSQGNYSVVVTDANGCTAGFDADVLAPTPPTITLLENDTVSCAGDTDGTLTVMAVPGGAPIASYSWSNAGSGATIAGLAPGTYTVTVTDEASCTTEGTAMVVAPDPLEVASLDVTNPLCPGFTNGQVSINLSGGTEPYVYTLDGNTQTGNNQVFFGFAAGTYTGEVTDANGCGPIPISVTFVDPPSIEVSFSGIQDVSCFDGICDGQATASAIYSDGTSGTFNFIWDSGEMNATATQLCNGNQGVTVTDADMCFGVDTVFVPSPPPILLTPVFDPVSCNGLSDGSITAQVSGGTGPYSYFWPETGDMTSTVSGLEAGTYSVVITDDNNCTLTQNGLVLEEPDPLMLSVNFDETRDVSCGGETDGILAVQYNSNDNINPVGPSPYTWSSNVPNPSQTGIVEDLPAGTYSVTITDVNGCTDELSYTISEPEPLEALIPDPDPIACFNGTTSISVDTVFGGTGDSYLDDFYFFVDISDITYRMDEVANNIFAGEHIVTVVDSSGCTFTDTIFIEQPPQIEVTFDTTVLIIELGDTTNILMPIINVTDIESYQWTPPFFLSSDTVRNPRVIPFNDVNYTLTVTDPNGCEGVGSIRVEVDRNRRVYIPNVFSPNGDGANDEFRIFACLGVREIKSVQIFDRWGEQLYEDSNLFPNCDTGGVRLWDGRFRGKFMNPGVFVYLIEIEFEDDVTLLYRGDITLLR